MVVNAAEGFTRARFVFGLAKSASIQKFNPASQKLMNKLISGIEIFIRYAILSVQAGIAVSFLLAVIRCTFQCGKYDVLIESVFIAAGVAVLTLIGLLLRHGSLNDSPSQLSREAYWQWGWICISLPLMMIFFPF